VKARGWLRRVAGEDEARNLGPRTDRPDIAASEIAEFFFCPRAWWLRRVRGITADSPRVQAGRAAHARVGAAIAQTLLLRRLIWAAIATAGAIVVAVTIIEFQP